MLNKLRQLLPSIQWHRAGQFITIAFKTIVLTLIFGIIVPALRWVAQTLAAGFHRTVKRHRRCWRTTQRAYRFYVIGQSTFLLGILLQIAIKDRLWPMPIMFVGAALFLFGFISRIQPYIRKAIASTAGQTAYRIAQGVIGVFAFVAARAVVYDALK